MQECLHLSLSGCCLLPNALLAAPDSDKVGGMWVRKAGQPATARPVFLVFEKQGAIRKDSKGHPGDPLAQCRTPTTPASEQVSI